MLHYESQVIVRASAEELFALLDDHNRLSQHMTKSSWMMAGSKMSIQLDVGQGKTPGSHIKLSGRVVGIPLAVEEVVVERDAPLRKVWETIGTPRLIVVGAYRMGFEIQRGANSMLRVFIDYGAPNNWLGRWVPFLTKAYARWCTERMANDAVKHFAAAHSSASATA